MKFNLDHFRIVKVSDTYRVGHLYIDDSPIIDKSKRGKQIFSVRAIKLGLNPWECTFDGKRSALRRDFQLLKWNNAKFIAGIENALDHPGVKHRILMRTFK